MKRASKTPGGSAAKLLWALALTGVFAAWTLHAFGPLVRLWNLDNLEQPGQLNVFNRATKGGFMGLPVELGDYDGDGSPDIAIAPMNSAGSGGTRTQSGEVYIYKGTGQIEGSIDRGEMSEPFEGVTITGARAGDMAGTEIFTADVNGDHIDDLIVSAQNYDGPAGNRDNCGGAFVLLGRQDLLGESLAIDLVDPPAGLITIAGAAPGERLGIWAEAGDVDGDGFQDILLGADQSPGTDPGGARFHAGKVVVIYGRAELPAVLDLANDAGGLEGVATILGRDGEDHFGSCIHARDLDLDGRAEIIASAALNRLSSSESGGSIFPAHSTDGADGPDNGREDSGEVTVIFSLPEGQRLPRTVDLAAPPPALAGKITTIFGRASLDLIGEEITTGDFNGDGRPDLVIGGLTASSPIPPFPQFAGIAHVLYWKEGLAGTTIDLAPEAVLPEGLVVSTLHGLNELAILGDTLSAGDFDHDGFDDLAVGIPHADVGDQVMAGSVAVAFGRTEPWPPLWAPQADTLPPGLQLAVILGRETQDLLSYSMEALDFDGDGYADIFPNAMRGDGSSNRFRDAGEAYLVSGHNFASPAQTPAIDGVEPTSGPVSAETPVVILGAGFTTRADTRIFAGAQEVTEFSVLTGRRIEAVLPASETGGPVTVTVTNRYGTAEGAFEYVKAFIRGDATLDGIVNITDPVRTLNGLFAGQGIPCEDASDANDDGRINITDPVATLGHLFQGAPPLPAPFPGPGLDPTPDDLTCG